jgi:hypothetical protein
LIGALNRGSSPSPAQLAQHFSASFLQRVPPKKLVAVLTTLTAQAPFKLADLLASKGSFDLQAQVTARDGAAFRATIAVSATTPHLIDGLLLQPLVSPIGSWSGVDAELTRLAGHASLYAGHANGAELHTLNASDAGAIGSAFKLYVLGALANAITQGSVQ